MRALANGAALFNHRVVRRDTGAYWLRANGYERGLTADR